jgi:putative sterol carrier protein
VIAFLSAAWIDTLDEALAADAVLADATRDVRLVIQHVVVTSSGERAYATSFDHGHNHVVAGRVPDPDVTFTCDDDTAARIATGDESAQQAFMAGRLRLGGDARVLIAAQTILDDADDLFAPVRAATRFERATAS